MPTILRAAAQRLGWIGDGPDWPSALARSARMEALLAGVLAALAVLVTPHGFGLSWDEAYYYHPSLDTAGWLAGALRLEAGWAGADAVREGFGRVWELPPVVKYANGLAWALAAGWRGDLAAIRLPSALAFGLATTLIYALAWLAWGGRRTAALAAAAAFATMPRVFGHAHLAASETMTILAMLAAVYAFIRGLQSARWAVLAAAALAVALDTKINAAFLPIILLPWAWLYARRQSVNNLFAWVFLAPLLVFLLWPWLWHSTADRVLAYLDFASRHPKLGLWFEGRKWNFQAEAAPWYYPLVITAVGIPPLTALMALGGALTVLMRRPATSLPRLFLWAVAVLFAVACAPSSPKYDGMRLFLPAMPFVALLAGGFVDRLAGLVPEGAFERARKEGKLGRWLAGKEGARGGDLAGMALTALLLAGGIGAIASIHPRELSYFNCLVGGLEGADRKGFEVSYWGEALNEKVIADLNATLPQGARVKTLSFHGLAPVILQEWGILRQDIRIDPPPPHDYLLMQYRKGFWGRFEEAVYKQLAPEQIWGEEGVPLMLLYRAPGAAARHPGGGNPAQPQRSIRPSSPPPGKRPGPADKRPGPPSAGKNGSESRTDQKG